MGASWQHESSSRPARCTTASLDLTHQYLPGMSVIAIGGEIDRTTSPQLADYVQRVRRPGDHVVFDLTELGFMDSSGLHVLLVSAQQAAADGVRVHLAAAQGAPARLLQITNVGAHLPVYVTVEQAITAVLTATRTH
ncbi:STAS domain-containing protein [Nonomuraea rosea]